MNDMNRWMRQVVLAMPHFLLEAGIGIKKVVASRKPCGD